MKDKKCKKCKGFLWYTSSSGTAELMYPVCYCDFNEGININITKGGTFTSHNIKCPVCSLPYFDDNSMTVPQEICKCKTKVPYFPDEYPNMGWTCPKCGAGNSPSTPTCPHCAPPFRVETTCKSD